MNKDEIKTFKDIRTKLLKVAQDELDITKQIPSGESGPQEVVDAVAEIASDLEQVISMIPAEPSTEEGVDIDEDNPEVQGDEGDVSPAVDPVEDPEKEIMAAKLAKLEKELDAQKKDVIANKIAELYGGKQDVYDKIMSSGKSSSFHAAQLETLEDFVKNAQVESKTQVAQDFSSYLKVAKQQEKKVKRKML